MKYFFKIKLNLLMLSCFFYINLNAQRQADVIVAGNSLYGLEWPVPGRNYLMVFNEDSLEYIDNETPIRLGATDSRAFYADKNANIKFASNGWRLINSFGEVLSFKLWHDDLAWPNDNSDTTNVINSKGPLFLEAPGDSSKVYLFYGQYKRMQAIQPSDYNLVNYDVYFTYALLDVETQSIISQNNIVLTDTTSQSDAVAVRHGNGRDWWILKPGIRTNEYYRALLDPSGLSEMEKITIPGLVPHEQFYSVSHFTQDGNKFIHFTGIGGKWAQRFDFDRCTGTLSNPIETDLNPLIRELDAGNFTISPDGSKVYFTRLYYASDSATYISGLHQYDFETDSLSLIARSNGLAFLTPNQKEIYYFQRKIPNSLTELYFSSITNPNGLANNCDTNMFKIKLENFPTMIYSPNIVNYRLGVKSGSNCDPLSNNSLGLQQQLKIGIDVFPNPNEGLLNVRLNNSKNKSSIIHIFSSSGQKVLQSQILGNSTQIDLRTLALPSGIYWVEVLCNEQLLRQKFVYGGVNY
jgi:hypothetical protein